jgi:CubicO group peptidase (beta-lactamase class C family)
MRLRSLAPALALIAPFAARAQQLTPTERARIDSAALAVLAGTGAPSASIAVVRGAALVYENVYGDARLESGAQASPAMRYAIGSVSKQFTAAAILMLAEEGKLSLDDKVSKWHEHLTRGSEISLRQLLSMTAGYQDYWPQDYVMPPMQRPTSTHAILHGWAGKPLDYEPGSKWQYSNTNYVMLAEIVEKVANQPFMDFLRQRIFTPLKMTSVADIDAGPLSTQDAQALLRNAIGPLRAAPKEGKGWLFGAGQLAMTARDLATWDLAMINGSLLRPESWKAMQTAYVLTTGVPTSYGLGVNVGAPGGRRRISHGGAVSGYTTSNVVYPDDKVAIVVYTNIYPGAAGAPDQIAGRIANVLFGATSPASVTAREQARRIYDGLVNGTVDRSLFTADANAYFTDEVLADYAASLGPLGAPREFTFQGESLRGGMTIRSYRIVAGGVTMGLTTMTLPDGKIDQYIVSRAG